jgi:hypothetical protein
MSRQREELLRLTQRLYEIEPPLAIKKSIQQRDAFYGLPL